MFEIDGFPGTDDIGAGGGERHLVKDIPGGFPGFSRHYGYQVREPFHVISGMDALVILSGFRKELQGQEGHRNQIFDLFVRLLKCETGRSRHSGRFLRDFRDFTAEIPEILRHDEEKDIRIERRDFFAAGVAVVDGPQERPSAGRERMQRQSSDTHGSQPEEPVESKELLLLVVCL